LKRRDFLALAGGATVFPRIALAQQPGGRKWVGLLLSTARTPDGSNPATDGVRAGLKEEGFIDGANVTLDVRYGLYDVGLIRAEARHLAGGGYDVLIGMNTPSTAALVAETKTIPIVFGAVADPVGSGFVQNFAAPGGNVTGFTNYDAAMGGKWLDMLHQVAPGVRRAVMMSNPDVAPGGGNFFLPSFQAAAGALGIEPVVVGVRTLAEIDGAITAMGKVAGTGLVVGLDSYTFSNSRTVVDAVARENVPAVYFDQRFVEQGGLISYEVDVDDIYRQAGRYAGLILKGARPSDLPVQAPTKYVLSVNLTTARTQGIGIPPDVLVLADEVIQ